MSLTEHVLITRSATQAQAEAHYRQRQCPHDHETVRLGSDGWECVWCASCDPQADD